MVNLLLGPAVYAALRQLHSQVIFLAGDSSLDNKYWATAPHLFQQNTSNMVIKSGNSVRGSVRLINGMVDALNGYEDLLTPRKMKPVLLCFKDSRRADHCFFML